MRLAALAAVFLAAPLFAGCITTIDGKPATATSPGHLYALPVPVLKFTPQGDGTLALEVLYVPDPNNTYSLEARTFLGASTLEVKTKGGLLESVTFGGDGTGVAGQAIESYGAIEAKKVEARLAAEKEEAAAAKERAKEAAAQAQAIADARTALTVAKAKRDKLVELGAGKDAVIAAEVAVVEADRKLSALVAQGEARASANALNLVGGGQPQAAGPVFFRMAPSTDGKVDLIADAAQVTGVAFKPPKAAPEPEPLTLSAVPPLIVRPQRNPQLKIRASKGFDGFWNQAGERSELTSRDGQTVLPWRLEKVIEDGQTYIYAILSDAQKPGLYDLKILVRQKAGDTEPVELNTITVDVRGRR